VIRYLFAAHKGKVIAAVAACCLLITLAVLGIVLPADRGSSHTARPPSSSTSPVADGQQRGSNVLSASERAQLDAAPQVTPGTSRRLPAIPADHRTQPDLYARAFFAALFVHTYTDVNRADMLAWVQAQQAATPFLTRVTPSEMNRLLVESATDPEWSNHGFAAIPDPGKWAAAAAGQLSVRIDRLVSIIPPSWEQAISRGAVTDPGLTERMVSGDMTMTMTTGGHPETQHVSVALTLLLEGPPTRGQYGAVVIADTNAVRSQS
jgi:hypothetical protein